MKGRVHANLADACSHGIHTVLCPARQPSLCLDVLDGTDKELVTHFDTDAIS